MQGSLAAKSISVVPFKMTVYKWPCRMLLQVNVFHYYKLLVDILHLLIYLTFYPIQTGYKWAVQGYESWCSRTQPCQIGSVRIWTLNLLIKKPLAVSLRFLDCSGYAPFIFCLGFLTSVSTTLSAEVHLKVSKCSKNNWSDRCLLGVSAYWLNHSL